MSYQLPLDFACPNCGKGLLVQAPVFTCCYCGVECDLHPCRQCGVPHAMTRTTGAWTCTRCQTSNAVYACTPCPWCSRNNQHLRAAAICYCRPCQARYFVDGSPNPPQPPREPGVFDRWFGKKCPSCGRKGYIQRMGSVLINQYLIYRNETQQVQRHEGFVPVLGSFLTVPVPVPYYHNTYRTTYLCTACQRRYEETSEEEVRA